MVAIAVMALRLRDPRRARPFRTPLVWLVGPVAAIGCVFLYWNLPYDAKMVLPVWGGIGLVFYFLYSFHTSHLGRGIVEVHEDDTDAPPQPVAPLPGGVELD
jgi:APA family basic amino acid/polyamine antiporter